MAFLQEFCSLAKHLQLQHRQNLWNKMTQLGMFEVRLGDLLLGQAWDTQSVRALTHGVAGLLAC